MEADITVADAFVVLQDDPLQKDGGAHGMGSGLEAGLVVGVLCLIAWACCACRYGQLRAQCLAK